MKFGASKTELSSTDCTPTGNSHRNFPFRRGFAVAGSSCPRIWADTRKRREHSQRLIDGGAAGALGARSAGALVSPTLAQGEVPVSVRLYLPLRRPDRHRGKPACEAQPGEFVPLRGYVTATLRPPPFQVRAEAIEQATARWPTPGWHGVRLAPATCSATSTRTGATSPRAPTKAPRPSSPPPASPAPSSSGSMRPESRSPRYRSAASF